MESGSPSPAPQVKRDKIKVEAYCYKTLIKDGGRPLYPGRLFPRILKSPINYHKALSSWLQPTSETTLQLDSWDSIFSRQLQRWRAFRVHQKEIRGIYDEELEYQLRSSWQSSLRATLGHTDVLNKLDIHVQNAKEAWYHSQEQNRRKRADLFDGITDFRAYGTDMQERLAKAGIQQPFQLDLDPTKQDKLTTWLEYCNFEYSWFQNAKTTPARLRNIVDEAFPVLKELNVLFPDEDDDSLHTPEAIARRKTEVGNARAQFEAARQVATMATTLAARQSAEPRLGHEAMAALHAASAKVSWTIRRHEHIQEYIQKTSEYWQAVNRRRSHANVVKWVLDQVPLVEAEMARDEVAPERGQAAANSTKRRAECTITSEQSEKRRRGDSHVPPSPSPTPTLTS